ncbi:MAG: sigma-70 family RNA polymerase sigma factor [Epulopiscium sp.]|nr:sigma-70 family RNA polymerase sigma factor [Candidatus Epulonipiscium sp.]
MYKDTRNGYYQGKYYIDGKEIELSDEIKEVFEEARKEEDKLLRRDRRAGLFRFDDYSTSEYRFIDSIADNEQNVENMILTNEKNFEIKKTLSSLDEEELVLLKLFVEKELTEREISKIIGVSHSTINYRKQKLKDKLRKLLSKLRNFTI